MKFNYDSLGSGMRDEFPCSESEKSSAEASGVVRTADASDDEIGSFLSVFFYVQCRSAARDDPSVWLCEQSVQVLM